MAETVSLARDSRPLVDEHAGPPRAGLEPLAPTRRRAAALGRLGQLARLVRTAQFIPRRQLAARARFMALSRFYDLTPAWPIVRARRHAAGARAADPLPHLPLEVVISDDLADVHRRAAALVRGCFAFLGLEADFSAGMRWTDRAASPLWLFNLHYLGAVRDLVVAGRGDAARWLLASWCVAFRSRWHRVAWHPYPASLRLSNLCLAAGVARRFEALGSGTADLVATHAAFLLQHLEYDLRGNHLLENAFALLLASRSLHGSLAHECDATARRVLAEELPEQILPDGAHFELSPMYHVMVLHRLLQATALLGTADPLIRDVVAPAVSRMITFLHGTLCPDGDIPLLGDSARGFAPAPRRLFEVASQLGFVSERPPDSHLTSFPHAGLYVLRSDRLWSILDAGPVCPAYLPGHGQADSLTLELWSDGACVVGDPGVHEYTGPERAWNRSSRAHSTVTIDDRDTSEVYGSFRVGGRARIEGVLTSPNGVTATVVPYGVAARITRQVRFCEASGDSLEIVDTATIPAGRTARSRLHLHPTITVVDRPSADERVVLLRSPRGYVRVHADQPLRLERGRASRHFGELQPTLILVQDLRSSAGSGHVASRFEITPVPRGVGRAR